MEQIYRLHVEITVVMRLKSRCANHISVNLSVSHSVDVLFSEIAMTLWSQKHINGIHFLWPPATSPCQPGLLGTNIHWDASFFQQKTAPSLPVYKQLILWANKWILTTADPGKVNLLTFLFPCDTLLFTHTLAASNPIWKFVCDFHDGYLLP